MTETTTNPRKTRNLPIYDFLEILQLEYISFKIRRLTYPIPKHKLFWQGIMEAKKKKIEEISSKNKLPNIFNDPYIEEQVESKFYINSTPNFLYRDEDFRKRWEEWDLYNYYAKNQQVSVETDEGSKVGYIVDYKTRDPYIYVNIEGIQNKYSIVKVRRIL